jgi:hypothetical protein
MKPGGRYPNGIYTNWTMEHGRMVLLLVFFVEVFSIFCVIFCTYKEDSHRIFIHQ